MEGEEAGGPEALRLWRTQLTFLCRYAREPFGAHYGAHEPLLRSPICSATAGHAVSPRASTSDRSVASSAAVQRLLLRPWP